MNSLFRPYTALILFLTCITSVGYATTRTAVANGDWGTNATWSPSGSPACGDSLVIPTGKTVTVASTHDYTACGTPLKITINGTLSFDNGKKLKLPCGSQIYIFGGGQIVPGPGGGNSNYIEICSAVVWTAGAGTLSGPTCLPFGAQPCATLMPIELVVFQAQFDEQQGTVDLSWITASELNNDHFTIERTRDGINYETISEIQGAGISNQVLHYVTRDEHPLSGLSYYRLRQTDTNGDFSFSYLVAMTTYGGTDWNVFPNPAPPGGFTMVLDNAEKDDQVEVEITSSQGQRVYEEKFNASGQNAWHIDLSAAPLPQGVYFVRVLWNVHSASQVLVVE